MERSTINQRVGVAIHQALKRRGMTQEQLALLIGTTQRSISAYVRGEQQPSLETLVMICQVLDLNLNQVLRMNETYYPYRILEKDEEKDFMSILDEVPEEKKEDFTAVVKRFKDLILCRLHLI